jgi:N-acyl-D-amino-acid deacylase
MSKTIIISLFLLITTSCVAKDKAVLEATILIKGGSVFTGENQPSELLDVAVCNNVICFVGENSAHIKAIKIIDATGLIVTPGFIDPHTHALSELSSDDQKQNLNYLTQGVTTVIIGNDGDGTAEVAALRAQLTEKGIGTNVGFLVGHNSVRKEVMGLSNSHATAEQLLKMKLLVAKGMDEGALGFSSGLYYVPGRYADTNEVIELAKEAAKRGGIYDSHIRDESTFNIGYLAAVKEFIEVAKQAKISAHMAHIKALGVDVWGQSREAINLINQARKDGLAITADQYPWTASGTNMKSAVIPSWVRADSDEAFMSRLIDVKLVPKIQAEIKENIRRRGGAEALLVTESNNKNWLGKTLQKIALENGVSPEQQVINMTLQENVRVASFNMSQQDIDNFMKQDWVVSSSDGTNGHPRKYASFPNKYKEYVESRKVITLQSFIHKSSGKTADIFNIEKRGYIKVSNYADINLIDINNFQPKADFSHWNRLSTGVRHQLINGQLVLEEGKYRGILPGSAL